MVRESDPSLIFSPIKIHSHVGSSEASTVEGDILFRSANCSSDMLGKRPSTPTERILSLDFQDKCLMNAVDYRPLSPSASASISIFPSPPSPIGYKETRTAFISAKKVNIEALNESSQPSCTLAKKGASNGTEKAQNSRATLRPYPTLKKQSSRLSADRVSASKDDLPIKAFKAIPVPKGIYNAPPRGIPAKVVRPSTVPKSPQFLSRKKPLNINERPADTQACATEAVCLRPSRPRAIDHGSVAKKNTKEPATSCRSLEMPGFIFKAKPAPKVAPFVPKKSTKPLTVGIAPQFLTELKKHSTPTLRSSASSTSRSSFESYSKASTERKHSDVTRPVSIKFFTEERASIRQNTKLSIEEAPASAQRKKIQRIC
ncbi:hypothetical protein MDAP_001236 [Mitosporidium daphniae]|uniref:Uncharacterized protein n=1 Tax=Mitosporidium daphniae TaxID=1485682 RepID=A0A098VSD0_9MICR|nr:uncharacterized protein DI09_22p30 [Mitosporidium daphniae]KGG51978.1 hypothetical protein DI09_22p30 [Mitosporidium daphniae]|eukprot:XP_013238434.1 uncharacterized protein DI09_22p30 [Mitosporidium daphniae]